MKKKLLIIVVLTCSILASCGLTTNNSVENNTFSGVWVLDSEQDKKMTISKNEAMLYDLNLKELGYEDYKNMSIERESSSELIIISKNKETKISIYKKKSDELEVYIADNKRAGETPPLKFKKG
ncbi:hypothetical protein [Enterococcus sp. AZ126]|uniref:hypothetical protein n=1 Tax=Enterococcus sp. AZ126 TaxID=2774635 RepID=UPI003F6861E3